MEGTKTSGISLKILEEYEKNGKVLVIEDSCRGIIENYRGIQKKEKVLLNVNSHKGIN